jgi:hypothetical protein
MQPYFLPYIGYFQLISAVDLFVVYDNIKYTKKGWINRNRFLQNGTDAMFTLPLKGAADSLDVRERELASDFNREKLLSQLRGAYLRAPYFSQTFPFVERIVRHEDTNLFRFLHHSIVESCGQLTITTPIRISSSIDIDPELKNQDKVLAICAAVGASTYVNAIGGVELYSREAFRDRGLTLTFIQSRPFVYSQLGASFVPWLSIIDVMMFNSPDAIRTCVSTGYDLI